MASTYDPRDEKNLPVITRWLDLTAWLLETTARMPKQWRPSLVHRIDEEAIQVLTLLTEAAYRRSKLQILQEANIKLSRLRILLELAQRVKALSPNTHANALVAVDEAGRMLGGWIKQVGARSEP